ncbi:PHB depolymerase family esterase [Methyloversatilis sp.]|uniref:extracellular catalytic domain type 1 short-chain-length polyhydroxyalkanoate depolymerase n=1 Tax=Methyloversatilis sp. TaxID=2569862 RepID=UPI002734CD37|nr:PHB depolymerase family esterase [Methyloversatilis sp.]MDP2868422.1 PHB depolymerase family esterase [Methyloversatilis sp.]MDP3287987.1 PHB depolymerase family esterase [Methyloversatilis sp.]MDP3454704.1 PHB depolymerase family esterase [Methyloversatilis sp.]MDP3579312.1 PHB depolymerase family esterase [Methyloversatilis sp.]
MQTSPQIEHTRRRRVIRRLLDELASCDPDDDAYERKLDLLGRRIARRVPPVAGDAASGRASGAGRRSPPAPLWQPFWRRQRARLTRLGGVLLKLVRVASARTADNLHRSSPARPDAPVADGSGGLTAADGRRVGRLIGRFGAGQRVEGVDGHYMLYEPAFRTAGPAPLLVMLHGCNQGAAEFAAGTRMNEVAEDSGVVVLYPEQSMGANALRCWNWYALQDVSNSAGDAALIARLTRRVMQDQDIDPARVYIAGMSAGGAMAAVLARDYPGLYAALGVHSGIAAGRAHDAVSAMRIMASGPDTLPPDLLSPTELGALQLPRIVFHGDADTTVHPSNADALYAASGQSGNDQAREHTTSEATPASEGQRGYTRSALFGSSGVSQGERWIIHGAGHAWTGGDGTQPHTDAAGPDASRQMMRFFLQHHLNSKIS